MGLNLTHAAPFSYAALIYPEQHEKRGHRGQSPVSTGANPGFWKGGVCLNILNRRWRRLSVSKAPQAPRGRGVRRGVLLTRQRSLGERRELPQRGLRRSPESYWIFKVWLIMAFPASLIPHLIQLKHITQTCTFIYTLYIREAFNF